MTINQAIPRDANSIANPSQDFGFIVDKTITFSNAANLGAIGAVPIFTVTGLILARIIPFVTTTLTGTGATVALGTTNNTGGVIAATALAQFAAGKLWRSTTTDTEEVAISNVSQYVIAANIIGTVAVANLTAGAIRFLLAWYPLSPDAAVS